MDKNRWLIELSEKRASQFWKVPFDKLTDAEKVFVAIWGLEADVNNGGFSQYYFNSHGDNSAYAPAALRAVGANAMARIVDQANAVFGRAGPPADRDARQRAIEALGSSAEETWGKLDTDFFAYPDDLTECLYTYVQAHKAQIRGM